MTAAGADVQAPPAPLPPGPRSLLGHLLAFAKDPVACHRRYRDRYGDPFTVRFPGMRMVVTGDEAAIRSVLRAPADQFGVMDAGAAVLGRYSLVRQEGEPHRRLRRFLTPLVMDPLRHGAAIRAVAEKELAAAPAGRPVTLVALAQRISLEVILRSVVGLTDAGEIEDFRRAFTAYHAKSSFLLHFVPALQIDLGPFSPWGRIVRARRRLDELIYAQIARARQGTPPASALADAVAAQPDDGDPLHGDESLRDQLMVMLNAGHESTANAIAWALYWCHRQPEVRQRLLDELTPLGASPDTAALSRLPYLDAVCRETLRIFPIGPVIGRLARAPLEIRGHVVPAGTMVGLSVALAHHDPAAYPEPERFRPERFLGASPGQYLPFGGGHRHCLGANLGLQELKIVLATALPRYRVELLDRKPLRAALTGATAGPKGGVRARLHRL